VLRWLSIQGLALVDSVELEFAPGLNVLTGETGAGKSLVLGSVGLLLGDRADSAWLRAGESRGSVEGTFDLSRRPDLIEALGEQEVEMEPSDSGAHVVLRREILADGRTRAFVNGRGVLLGQLRAVGDLLVDLHGQHEHQQLLDPARQADFFDAWAETLEARRALEIERSAILEDRRRAAAAREALEKDRAEEESLRADCAELDALKLEPGEEEALLRDRERLLHRERILQGLSEAIAPLSDEETGAEARLRRAAKALRAAAALDASLGGLVEEAEAASDAAASLGARAEEERARLLEEPLDLEGVEERLDRIHRLKRKHRADSAGLLALADELRSRVRSLEPGAEEAARLERALASRIATYDRGLDALAERRAARAAAFERAAGALLARLGFGAARLRTALAGAAAAGRSRAVIDPAPIPALEFEFQPNPGDPPRPLRRIASGGELSRVMLAVKSLMADRDRVAVLVFDEVDQGIGGAVGEEVGALLRDLGSKRQVLCITHLPLIAACAERQLHVAKAVARGRTSTTVAPLTDAERVDEIARLLAGARATETSRKQARELLSGARAGAARAKRPAPETESVRREPAAARRAAKGKG
jgi:DNA repair protein RecN (Recombination protein N)